MVTDLGPDHKRLWTSSRARQRPLTRRSTSTEGFVDVPSFHGSFVPYSSLGMALILTLERVLVVSVTVAILVRVHDTYPHYSYATFWLAWVMGVSAYVPREGLEGL